MSSGYGSDYWDADWEWDLHARGSNARQFTIEKKREGKKDSNLSAIACDMVNSAVFGGAQCLALL